MHSALFALADTEEKTTTRIAKILAILSPFLLSPVVLSAADVVAPTPPTALIATPISCGQVDLSWTVSADDIGGSGLKAYIITRNDPNGELFRQVTQVVIGAGPTTFSDTNYVRSAATLSYTVAAQDYAGNISTNSNVETVQTPVCPSATLEQIVDDAYIEPLERPLLRSARGRR
jgi:hypothetical protein